MRDIDNYYEANIKSTLFDTVLQGYSGPKNMRDYSSGDGETIEPSYGVIEIRAWFATSKHYNWIPILGTAWFAGGRTGDYLFGYTDWRYYYFDETTGEKITKQQAEQKIIQNRLATENNDIGDQLYQEGNYEGALEKFKLAYENSHENYKHFKAFELNFKNTQNKVAEKYHEEGVQHFNNENYQSAVDKFRQAKNLTNDENRAKTFREDEEHAESRVFYVKGNELQNKQEYNDSINEYRAAIDRSPRSKISSINLYKDSMANIFHLQGQDFWNQENFRDAKKKFQDAHDKVTSIQKRNIYKSDVTHAESAILNQDGVKFMNQQRYDEAIQKFTFARNTVMQIQKTSSLKMYKNNLAEAYHKNGFELWKESDFRGAADNFRNALKETVDGKKKQLYKIDMDHVEAMVLNNEGNALRAEKKLSEAVAKYEDAIKLVPKEYAISLNTFKNNLAAIYHMQGVEFLNNSNFRAAADKFRDALNETVDEKKKQEYKIDMDHAEAMVFNNEANALRAEKRFNEAVAKYEDAIKLVPKKYAISLNTFKNNLAAIYHMQGVEFLNNSNFRAAADKFRDALNETADEKKKQRYNFHIDVAEAMVLNNEGNIFQDEKRLSEAVAKFQDAIKLVPKEYYTSLNIIKNNLAATYHMQGVELWNASDFRAAADKFRDALNETVNVRKNQEYKIDMDHAEAMVLNNEGNALRAENRLNEAVAKYQAALMLVPKKKVSSLNMINNNLVSTLRMQALEVFKNLPHRTAEEEDEETDEEEEKEESFYTTTG